MAKSAHKPYKRVAHTLFCHLQALYCHFDSWEFVNGHFPIVFARFTAWISHNFFFGFFYWERDEIPETCDKTCSSSLIYHEMIHWVINYLNEYIRYECEYSLLLSLNATSHVQRTVKTNNYDVHISCCCHQFEWTKSTL